MTLAGKQAVWPTALILLVALPISAITTPVLAGQSWYGLTQPVGPASLLWGVACAVLLLAPLAGAMSVAGWARRHGALWATVALAGTGAYGCAVLAGLFLAMGIAMLGGM